ncbi:MAG: hypothetical protein MJ152_01165 [Clostridia bacterium]|nr:hypothetical protein [Clostridia bacterium]
MANSTAKISKQDFDRLLLALAEVKPCSFYVHGVGNGNEDAIKNVIFNGEDFLVYNGQNNIFSTFVDAGEIDANLQNRITEYEYAGRRYNIIMITPSNATVKNYAGNLGEKDTTAEESGYTNHVLVDYIVGGANKHFNPEENKDANMYISSVSNKLILGLYDIETGEYIINKNCMVFDDKEAYDNAVEQMSTYAAEYYKYAAFIQLSFNLNLRTYNILSTLQDEKRPSIKNKTRDILLYLAGEFYKKTEEYSSYLKPKDGCVFHSGSFFPSLYHALIDMINSNEIMPDVLVEILKETNGDTNKLKDNSNYKILLTYAEDFLKEKTKILLESTNTGISI